MLITTTEAHLRTLLDHAAELGAQRALERAGIVNPTITRPQAERIYGRRQIDRWIKERLIKVIQDGPGATHRISVSELESVAKASNRHTYLRTDEQ